MMSLVKKAAVAALFLFAAGAAHATGKEVNLYVSRNVAPGPKIRIQINTKNLGTITLRMYRLDALDYLRVDPTKRRHPSGGTPVGNINVNMMQRGQRFAPPPQDNYFTKQINLPDLKPGVYLFESTDAVKGERWVVVNITNLAVVTKRSQNRLLTWVTDFKSGQTLKDVEVFLANQAGQTRLLGKTNPDGTHIAEMRPANDRVIVKRGGDYAEVSATGFDHDNELKAHIQTDRPIYRPGQKVSYKAIMRLTKGQGYVPIANADYRVELRDPRDTLLDVAQVKSNAIGSVVGSFDLPAEGAIGSYSLVFVRGKERSYLSVPVQAYRKPEYKVGVTPETKRALAGEKIRFKVKAEYYFGAPVPQAEVQWTARRSDYVFYESGENDWAYNGDGNLYPRDTYDEDPFQGEGKVYTDNKGEVTIELNTDPKAPDSTYSISLTVTDGSRRQVTGGSSMPVYAAELRLGLSTQMLAIPLGKLIPVDLRLVDLDGKPAAGTVELKLLDTRWNEKKNESEDVVLATQTVKVPTNGRASTNLPAKAAGGLRIVGTVKDRTGRVNRSEMGIYISGPFTKAEKEQEEPEIELKLDKKAYLPGDTVNLYVANNRATRPVLVTAEGDDLWEFRVIQPSGPTPKYKPHVPEPLKRSSVSLAFKTDRKQVPNVIYSVISWVDGRAIQNEETVYLYDKTRKVDVVVTPDKTSYEPGDKAVYKIKTTSAGVPVAAEVAVGVVDEAIFAIMPDTTPDLFRTYWGHRDNKVNQYESCPEEVSGGAFQRANAAANVPLRQRFEDTAFWNAVVTTDAQGEATVEFEVPGNLTTWRTTARAVTAETRVGMSVGTVLATRPFTLRLATPRQMTVGDKISLIATVNNRTKEEKKMRVDLKVGGVTLSRQLTVAPGVEGRAVFPVEARELGRLSLEGRLYADNGDALDALLSTVPVVPDGVEERIVEAGQMTGSKSITFNAPGDMIADAGSTRVRVWGGPANMLGGIRTEAMKWPRYGTVPTAVQVRLAAMGDFNQYSAQMREAVAFLSRTQTSQGWGYWEGGRVSPYVTALVLEALVAGRQAEGNVPVPRITPEFVKSAIDMADYQYANTQLWEFKAVLAAALNSAGFAKADGYLQEIKDRAINLSPYARIRVALATNDPGMIDPLVKGVSRGTTSFLPVGLGIGWHAGEMETNAWLIRALAIFKRDRDLQGDILRHLLANDTGYRAPEQDLALALALEAYAGRDARPSRISSASVSLNGKTVAMEMSRADGSYSAVLDRPATGANKLDLSVSGEGEVFYQIDARVYRPLTQESQHGVRVFRRFEVRNENGVWVELDREIRPNEPVRVTALVWGDSLDDPMRLVEPIPAGFEFLEDDWTMGWSRSEVRDGSITHYLDAEGLPLTVRYYLRAETDGQLIVSPAIVDVLRRPENRGQSRREEFKVAVGPPAR